MGVHARASFSSKRLRLEVMSCTAMGLGLLLIAAPRAAAADAPLQDSITPSTATAGNSATAGVAEVVVTAERRSSTVQRTPATIEVLNGAELKQRGVGSVTDALSNVSGVFVQMNNKGADINIRGVGTTLDSATGDPGVNTNLDGVYLRQASTVVSGLYDVSRIEVLKGPQGTLYGRNATGGVVNILSNDPKPVFGYEASLTVGNYDLIRSEGAVNVPITADLAARVAFGSESHKGYLNGGQDDADRKAGRVKLLWTPEPAVRILVGTSYAHDGGIGPGSVSVTEPVGSRQADTAPPVGQLDQGFVTVFSNIGWDAGPLVVTVIPTYSNYLYNYRGNNFGQYNEQKARESQETGEFRLSSPGGSKIQWVTGLYLYNDTLNNVFDLFGPGVVNNQPDLKAFSYAGFGDATVPLTSALRLIGGARYTNDHHTQADTTVSVGGHVVGPFGGVLNSSAVTYRAGAEYDLTRSAMAYVTYATGYKSGGFTPDEPGYNTFKPEYLRSIEGGVKSRWFDNQLQVNIGGFDYSYDDYQVSEAGIAHYGGLSALVFNSQGKTTIYGAELGITYRPTADDQIDLSVSPMHSQFGTFIIPASPFSAEINSTGKELPSAPAVSGSGAYAHTWNLPDGSLVGRVETYVSDPYWVDFAHSTGSRQPGYTKTDLNLTYFSPHGWSIGAYGKNLENSWIVSLKANTLIGDYALEPPRTFGITVGLSM